MDFTLEENLGLKNYFREPFSHKGVLDKAEFSQYGNELIDRYDIRSSQGNKTIVRSMSGGNQQKAIIGREIELQSPLMIFVQPTRGLDIGAIERVHKTLLQLKEQGKAILLISAELSEVMNLSDRIAVFYEGEVSAQFDNGEYTKEEMELAQAIAANAQVAVRQSKAAIRRGLQTDMYTGAAYEAEAFGLCFATEDQKDAMTAFVNKEKVAAFKNR